MDKLKHTDAENQSFVRLVEQYQTSVLRTCYLYLADRTLAEDAAQETFFKVYRAMGEFRGESSEKTWILKIALRTCLDMNRSKWILHLNRQVTPDMLPEPVERLKESDDELICAVMNLPRRLKEVILLYYYQDLKVQEIADMLGISQSAVSGRLQRGRERLKNCLEGKCHEGE